MRRLEHRAVLDADAGQVGDFEEAPIVDLIRRHPPVREPVVLPLEQPMQRHGIFHGLQIPGGARIEREAVVEVAHAPAPAFVLQLELSRFQRLAIVLAQHGKEQFPAAPVDVEVARVRRRPAFLQHIQPPRVVGVQHAHVVGNEIGHQAHPVLAQGFYQ
ncbi:MAG: hypothetical protein AUH79_00540 [Betaproteobacteria bacterium 13_1_40CM_4_64_4]|nr:MAG: hypothetical protein AUH79_00540 [Betaproteobacteria bacterium 13_1_40CM_4_64_4]